MGAKVDNFLATVIAERGVEEEGAVDALVGCCVDGGRVRWSLEECREGWGECWWEGVHACFGQES